MRPSRILVELVPYQVNPMNQWTLSSQEGTIMHALVCCPGPVYGRAAFVVCWALS